MVLRHEALPRIVYSLNRAARRLFRRPFLQLRSETDLLDGTIRRLAC